jgi:hypothetical protein
VLASLVPDGEYDFARQYTGRPGGAQLPPPAPRTTRALVLLDSVRKKLDDDTTAMWLLVGLAALAGWLFSGSFVYFIGMGPWMVDLSPIFGFTGGETVQIILGIFAWLTALSLSLVLPTLVIVGANRAFKRQYDMVTADLVHGDLGLMLIDESYGRMIQEWREAKYRPVLGEVHLGTSLSDRLHHFAAYYPHYYALSQGRREFPVQPATPLNCWMDGLLIACLGCNTTGCLYWFIVPLPMRVVYTYPKTIATRRAVLDYLYGKWEGALERMYVNKLGPAPANPP